MAYDYIKDDLAGYPFNAKYPPRYDLYGGLYHGYKNAIYETFLYDFAVLRYDLKFVYNNKEYYFLSDKEYAASCDETFTHEVQRFDDGNAVLEQFLINGIKLLDLLPEIEDCEAV